MAGKMFEVVSETAAADAPKQTAPEVDSAIKFLMAAFSSMLSIQALAQRATVAIGRLFPLITSGFVFGVWMNAPDDPTVHQLVNLGMFAAFVLIINAIVLWRAK